jgi:hypothetical protein
MNEPRVVTWRDHEMLKREMGLMRRECTNLRNTLASFGMRRHQAMCLPGGERLQWFSLSETLDEFGEADAFDAVLNESSLEWEEDPTSDLTTVYSTVSGVTGSDGDIVLCRWIKDEKKWEVLTKPAAGLSHAIGLLTGGTLDACDISATGADILDATMPSQVGDVYLPADDGTWLLAEEDATIFNRTPFEYNSSSPLVIEKTSGLWIATRADMWTPYYHTTFNGAATTATNVTFDGAPATKGNLASEATDTITIQAPVPPSTYRWEVDVNALMTITNSVPGNILASLTLLRNGASVASWTNENGAIVTAGTYYSYHQAAIRTTLALEEGDTLKVLPAFNWAGGPPSGSLTISVSGLILRPLF